MFSYQGKHAELYDLFYNSKPYKEEAAFIHSCLQEFGSGKIERILELACGTGSHSIFLSNYDYHITATDYSDSMLAVARKKTSMKKDAKIYFSLQDMTNINLNETNFDAAICLFDSIGYVETISNVNKVFNSVYSYLKNNGLFIFEFWHAAAMLRNYEPLRIRRWEKDNQEILRISETEIDAVKQIASVKYTIYEFNSDGTYISINETQRNRFFLVEEMSQLLISAGFVPLKWFDGYSRSEKITPESWHILSVVRKK